MIFILLDSKKNDITLINKEAESIIRIFFHVDSLEIYDSTGIHKVFPQDIKYYTNGFAIGPIFFRKISQSFPLPLDYDSIVDLSTSHYLKLINRVIQNFMRNDTNPL